MYFSPSLNGEYINYEFVPFNFIPLNHTVQFIGCMKFKYDYCDSLLMKQRKHGTMFISVFADFFSLIGSFSF